MEFDRRDSLERNPSRTAPLIGPVSARPAAVKALIGMPKWPDAYGTASVQVARDAAVLPSRHGRPEDDKWPRSAGTPSFKSGPVVPKLPPSAGGASVQLVREIPKLPVGAACAWTTSGAGTPKLPAGLGVA